MRRHRRKYFPIRSGGCVLHFLLVPVLELSVCGHPHHYRASSSKKKGYCHAECEETLRDPQTITL